MNSSQSDKGHPLLFLSLSWFEPNSEFFYPYMYFLNTNFVMRMMLEKSKNKILPSFMRSLVLRTYYYRHISLYKQLENIGASAWRRYRRGYVRTGKRKLALAWVG